MLVDVAAAGSFPSAPTAEPARTRPVLEEGAVVLEWRHATGSEAGGSDASAAPARARRRRTARSARSPSLGSATRLHRAARPRRGALNGTSPTTVGARWLTQKTGLLNDAAYDSRSALAAPLRDDVADERCASGASPARTRRADVAPRVPRPARRRRAAAQLLDAIVRPDLRPHRLLAHVEREPQARVLDRVPALDRRIDVEDLDDVGVLPDQLARRDGTSSVRLPPATPRGTRHPSGR